MTAAPFDTTAWTSMTTAQKEGRLTTAAEIMEQLPWRGYKAYVDQALCFPRLVQVQRKSEDAVVYDSIVNTDGFRGYVSWSWVPLGSTDILSIPTKIKEAQAYIAWLVVHRGLSSLKSPTKGVGGAPVKSVNLGGQLAVQFADTNYQSASMLRNMVMSDEFPIAIKIAPFITRFRGYSGDLPVLQSRVA